MSSSCQQQLEHPLSVLFSAQIKENTMQLTDLEDKVFPGQIVLERSVGMRETEKYLISLGICWAKQITDGILGIPPLRLEAWTLIATYSWR